MFELFVVFVVVSLFALLPEFIPGISRKVVDLVVQETEDESKLRQELHETHAELTKLNIVDEFAKHAKAERKLNRLKEELSKHTRSRSDVFLKIKFGTNIAFHLLQLVCFLSLIYAYRSTPLLKLPPDWMYPISFIISFPTGVPGAVSITFWLLVCRSVVGKTLQLCGR